jgi:hypothetical protein
MDPKEIGSFENHYIAIFSTGRICDYCYLFLSERLFSHVLIVVQGTSFLDCRQLPGIFISQLICVYYVHLF